MTDLSTDKSERYRFDRPPVRSALFVPGNRAEWIAKSHIYRADAVVIDLEDATPEEEKPAARQIIKELIPTLRDRGQAVWVRVNGIDTEHFLEDVEAACQPGLHAICLPKTPGPAAVRELDRLLAFFEGRSGLLLGSTGIAPLLETAAAIVEAGRIFRSSPRVCYSGAIAAWGGDVQLSVGYKWSDSYEETFVLRSQALLAARAAGIDNPITGLITDLTEDPVRRFAEQSRAIGYSGMYVIHPTHVAIANEVFGPSEEELAWANTVLSGYASAQASGRGAFRDDSGAMIDFAHVRTAERILEAHRAHDNRETLRGD